MKKSKKLLSLFVACCLIAMLLPVSVSAALEGEDNDTFDTAQSIAVNESVRGNLVASSDVDYYKVSLSSPGYIWLTFNHEYVDSGWRYWNITIFDEDNQALVTYSVDGKTTKEEFNAIGIPGGSYYAKVSPDSHSDVPYDLTINYTSSSAWETEFNNTFDMADSISANSEISGNLMTSSDVDYYKIDLSSPGYIWLTFNHEYIDSGWRYWNITIFNEDNQALVTYSVDGKTTKEEFNAIGIPGGSYYAKVSPDSHSDVPYDLTINYTSSSAWETEFNNTFDTADPLSVNTEISGSLMTSSDVDYYKIDLNSPGYIWLAFNHEYVDSGWRYWNITIFDEDNQALVTYSVDGKTTKEEFNAIGIPGGSYYAKVSPDSHSDVPYDLTINYTSSSAWETEFNNTFDTADPLSVNTEISGSLMTSSDVDYYKIDLSSPGYVWLAFNHEYIDSGWKYWNITVYDGNKHEITSYGVNGKEKQYLSEGMSLVTGTYYLKVAADSHSDIKYSLMLSTDNTSTPTSPSTTPVSGISLSDTSLSLTAGDSARLYATVSPSNATNASVEWSSSNTSVATVSNSGVVTAKAEGKATIIAKTTDGGHTASCSVTVKQDATSGETSNSDSKDDTSSLKPDMPSKPSSSTSISERFFDVPAGHWAEEAINEMARIGLLKGVDDVNHIYSMDGIVTRGTVATILFRLSNGKANIPNSFPDVSDGAWYADGVAWAAQAGVVTGYDNGNFGPENTVTREQFTVMLYRYAELIGVDTAIGGSISRFDDRAAVSNWATAAMTWAVSAGIIQGVSGNTLAPAGTVTRAQCAVMLARFVNLI